MLLAGGLEHGVGLTHPGAVTQENLQPTAVRSLLLGLNDSQKVLWIGTVDSIRQGCSFRRLDRLIPGPGSGRVYPRMAENAQQLQNGPRVHLTGLRAQEIIKLGLGLKLISL
jgi:hypothetical protein